jgi:site-specific recombinase XerD
MELVAQTKLSHVADFLKNFTSPHTRRAYEKDLQSYAQFSVGMDPFSLATMISYREHLTTHYASATSVRKLASLRSFMSFIAERGVITADVSKHLRLPKVKTETHTQAFTDEEAVQMMSAPDLSDFYGSTHRFVLFCLFNLGLRRSELVSLKLSDFVVNKNASYVQITGKGDKQRILALSEAMVSELERYLSSYQKFTAKTLQPSDFVVQSSPDQVNEMSMNPATIYKIVDRYSKQLGIDRKVSPHSCRATVISQLLEKSVSPRDVAKMAGHASISTTVDIYDKHRDAIKNSAALKVSYAG